MEAIAISPPAHKRPEVAQDGQAEAEHENSALSPAAGAYSVQFIFQAPPWADVTFHAPRKGPPPPPTVEQRIPGQEARKDESRKVVISAPLSFGGSAERIWKQLVGMSSDTGTRTLLAIAAVFLIALVWCFVLCWYLVWGIVLVPYRRISRGARKRKQEARQHHEGQPRKHDSSS